MTDLPEIDMTYWNYDDGSIGAKLDSHPDGLIGANDFEVMLQGLKHLIDAKEQAIQSHRKKRRRSCLTGILNVPMEGKWIDGRFCIRFMRVKGFGISFSKPENFEPWINAFFASTTSAGGVMNNIFQALSHLMEMCAFELQETVEELMSWGKASFDDGVATFGDMHVIFSDGKPLTTFSDQDRIEWNRHFDEEQWGEVPA